MKNNIIVIAVSVILVFLLLWVRDPKQPIEFSSEDGFLVQHVGDSDEDIYTKTFILEEGAYHAIVNYTSSESGNYLSVKRNDIEIDRLKFDAGEGQLRYDFDMEEASSNMKFSVHFRGGVF